MDGCLYLSLFIYVYMYIVVWFDEDDSIYGVMSLMRNWNLEFWSAMCSVVCRRWMPFEFDVSMRMSGIV